MRSLFRRRATVAPDPGWRAPNDVIEYIAVLTRQRDAANQRYADAYAELDQTRKELVDKCVEAAELRHLPDEVRRLKGSLDLARARNAELARDLRLARQHLDQCPNSTTPEASTL